MARRTGDFPAHVIRRLAELAAHRCSNPACQELTVRSHSDPKKAVNLGRAAHIAAAEPRGPRYDPLQTDAERRGIANGIWLCARHADEVDKDAAKYPATLLHEWKERHRAWVDQMGVPALPAFDLRTIAGRLLQQAVPTALAPDDFDRFREHVLAIENRSRCELKAISMRGQFPEPLVKCTLLHVPAGVNISVRPDRIPMMAVVSGGGSVVGHPGPPQEISIEVDALRPGQFVRLSLLSIAEEEGHHVPWPDGLRFFIQGSFSYAEQNRVLTSRFLIPLAFAPRSRRIRSAPPEADNGQRPIYLVSRS